MASPWINTFETLPANNQDCWIRVPYYYGAPVKARFTTTVAIATLVPYGFNVNADVNLRIPFYMVPRWKPWP